MTVSDSRPRLRKVPGRAPEGCAGCGALRGHTDDCPRDNLGELAAREALRIVEDAVDAKGAAVDRATLVRVAHAAYCMGAAKGAIRLILDHGRAEARALRARGLPKTGVR